MSNKDTCAQLISPIHRNEIIKSESGTPLSDVGIEYGLIFAVLHPYPPCHLMISQKNLPSDISSVQYVMDHCMTRDGELADGAGQRSIDTSPISISIIMIQ